MVKKILIIVIGIFLIMNGIVLAQEYKEAPQLKKLVEKGDLPPVEERLPQPGDIYIVEPVERIGEYGGTLRTVSTVPESAGGDTMLSIFPNPVKPSADLSKFIPHVIKKLESSKDKHEWTMYLRKGMKWSDGYPFTTADIMFWYEDMLNNKELTPSIGEPWSKLERVKQINKYKLTFVFTIPQPFFANDLVHTGAWDLFMPKHYLKQFHPKYSDKAKLEKIAQDNNFDHWYELFAYKNGNIWGTPIRKGRPGLTPYVFEKMTSSCRVFKRNPYYWKIDTAENQLPYIDRIECEIVANLEVVQGMILSGELDFAGRNTDLQNYPMYKNNEKAGNYKTILWNSTYGSTVFFSVNMTDKDPVLREIFQNVKFRRALSLAINREEINDVVYFGKGVPRQYTVLPESKYFEPSFAKSYAEFNPERARQLLDEMGLNNKDSQGYRLRPDGKRLTFTIEYPDVVIPRTAVTELVVQMWRSVGVDVHSKTISGELMTQRAPGNMLDATNWVGDRASDILFPVEANYYLLPHGTGWERAHWPLWETWFVTEGKKGEEPPANIKQLHSWWQQILVEPDQDKRIKLSKKILKAQAENLWVIGTVGMIPHPLIVNKRVHNFPGNGYWGWDTGVYSMNRDPSQIFLEK